jgi:spermidine synthase
MFGLFAGSWLIGRYINTLQNELRWYAFFEIAIGSYALLLLAGFGLSSVIFNWLYQFFSGIEILHSFAKFLVTLLLIFIPTAAMGATLPLVVQYYTKHARLFGENISLFYAVNTIGGAIGAVFAGFYLIENVGIKHGIIVTAGINITIGLVVLLAIRKTPQPAPQQENRLPKSKKKKASPSGQLNEAGKLIYLLAAALSGFAALALEIIWSRGLKFVIHNSTYSFAVVLFVFLLGIAIGSGLAKKLILKVNDLHYLYGALQMGLGIYTIFTVYLLYKFSYGDVFQNTLVEIIYDYSYHWFWGIVAYILISAVLLLVPTIIMGILFPVINTLFFKKILNKTGQTVSSIYAVNTIGSIIGSLCAGFLLLPLLGIKWSIMAILLINLFLGVIFVIKSENKKPPTFIVSAALLALAFSLSFNGEYLYGRGEEKTDRVLFYKEGLMSTVKVFERQKSYFMSIDGNIIASTHPTLYKKEKLIAHLPFFVKPDIKNVLAVGLASGISVGSMGLYTNIGKIDCVELIKPVFPAATYFRPYNFDIFNHPKVNLIYDDIYAYLMFHDQKYDLISSDGKLGTLYSGNTIMLSKDFYELCKQRMTPDGLFIQWIPIITPHHELQVILDTLKNSFQHVLLFYFYPTDIFMIASQTPMVLNKDEMDQVFSSLEIQHDLERIQIKNAEPILSAFIGEYETPSSPNIEISTFDRPILEFSYMREWKKSKQWAGGYRAKNLEYLVENFQTSAVDKMITHIEESTRQNIITGSRLFFKGCIEYFKTGHFQNSFREYHQFRESLKS